MQNDKATSGYYTVNLNIDGKTMPYVVFARSEFAAARKVKFETGCMVTDKDVEGPFPRYIWSTKQWLVWGPKPSPELA